MKKILFMAAALAVFTACSKTDDSSASFTSGDLITLTASFDMPETKARPDDPTSETVKFHWESGDYVLITNETGSSKFTIKDGSINGNKACFTGKALKDMDHYTVYYGIDPAETASRHNVQYIPESFTPKVSGEGEGTEFCLDNFYPVLKLQLDGNVKLGKIECSIAGDTTVMSFPEGLQLKTDITAVYFPAMYYKSSGVFTINFFDSDGMLLQFLSKKSTYKRGDKKKNLFGKIVTMPDLTLNIDEGTKYYIEENTNYGPGVSSVGAVWAPVNCGVGHDNTNPFGLLYQWGRKYGQAFPSLAEEYTPLADPNLRETCNLPENRDNLYRAYYDEDCEVWHNWWFDFQLDSTLWNANERTKWSEPVAKGQYDPCPDGWRVPSEAELTALVKRLQDANNIQLMSESGVKCLIVSTESEEILIFPQSGRIGGALDENGKDIEVAGKKVIDNDHIVYKGFKRASTGLTGGYYWCSTGRRGKVLVDDGFTRSGLIKNCFVGRCMYINDKVVVSTLLDSEPFVAYSVRCVQENK